MGKKQQAHISAQQASFGLRVKQYGFFLGPAIFISMLMAGPADGIDLKIWQTMALGLWMISWWMSEAAPLSATALLPVIILPLFGVMDLKTTLIPYANPIIFLFLGGFIIAVAIQKSNLHVRIALNIVNLIGTRPDKVIAGFMIASAFLSMWISNTATVLMMLPISLSVVTLMQDAAAKSKNQGSIKRAENFAINMMLGIAFASSVGGIGTLIGTPPNAFFKGYFSNNYALNISFVQWMSIGLPVVIFMTVTIWLLLTKIFFPVRDSANPKLTELVEKEINKLGRMSTEEKITTFVFCLTAMGWFFRSYLDKLINFGGGINDVMIAIFGAMLLFLIPVNFKKGEYVINWRDAEKIPWGVLILFGGGLSLATGFQETGLAGYISTQFEGLELSRWIILLILIACTNLSSSLMSNVATITIFLPIVVSVSVGIGENPLFFAIPVTMIASCAFLLPVSTANNAIVYGTGHVKIAHMIKTGMVLSMIAISFICLLGLYFFPGVMGIEAGVLPAWAK